MRMSRATRELLLDAGIRLSIASRNNVKITGTGTGTGAKPMVFAHGFGCDQSMWRYLTPNYEKNYKTVVYDLVGSGQSDLTCYDRSKYDSLHGHADDLLEVIDESTDHPVIFVGHSVSAIIGMLASIKQPSKFSALVMVGPSPSYIDDGDYVGGFGRTDILELLSTLESNYLGWSSTMAPAIMGAPDQPELADDLTNSFCRTDPQIAKHFARVTFMSDHRSDLAKTTVPTLIIQCTDDIIAPQSVGKFMAKAIPDSTLRIIENVGHCPHLSAPSASAAAINAFLEHRSL
jgi:sigma-B regulation protein RsbQ